MIIVETFEPGCQPQLWPLPTADRDCRLTCAEMWRILGLAVGGVLVFVGIGVAELLLMH
jgi:hypothetical protein